jgi:hypothetical protein
LIVSSFITAAPALAEGPTGSETPVEDRAEINVPAGSATAPIIAVSLPDAPVPKSAKVIDKKFIAVMGTLAGAESLRFTTHKLVLDHEYAAGAPWVTRVPANQHLVVKYGGIYASELLVAYELKKPHSWLPGDKVIRKLWWVAPAALVPIHLKNGIRSIRTQNPSPGGCDSVAECEAEMQ